MTNDLKHEETGIYFKDGQFQKEFTTIELSFDEKRPKDFERLFYDNGYYELFVIGNEAGFHVTGYFNSDRDPLLPMYLIEIWGHSNREEIFFINSIVDLNAFLKEINPLIEVSKYQEEQERRLDEEAKAKGYS